MRWLRQKKVPSESKTEALLVSKVPTHIAIIMDGNGRWAQLRGEARIQGHREGAKRVDEIVTECAEMGVKFLTLYTFSTENWERPKSEVNMLMRLLVQNLKIMDKKLLKNGIKLEAQGTLERLPDYVQKELERVMKITDVPEPKMTLSLALSYGGRQEILDATKKMFLDLKKKKIALEEVGEELFRSYLYHPHFPDPDLLIRTGGDCRVSNFLLWEVAYSEIIVRDEFWPEFTTARLREAISQFGQRERRFGKTSEQVTGVSKSQDLETV
ncbi:di-trans,poly-cis-decaprenylcistransferase [bacterium]|nr:di-trans,poly-cis-decaprenylcistransferase [bacterium]